MGARKDPDGDPTRWRPELQKLGERLRFARTQRGMTQKGLASLSGVDNTTIGRIEAGVRLAQVGALMDLADALGVPSGWLIAGEGSLPELAPAPSSTRDRRRRKSD